MPDNTIDNSVVERYAGLEGRDLIKSILRDYPEQTALVSSFGAESAVLLHMVSEVDPDLPIIFLDTGKLFQETLDYRDKLIAGTWAHQCALGEARCFRHLETQDPDGLLASEQSPMPAATSARPLPLEKALTDFDVVISGRKRFHGAARADLDFVSIADDRLKVEPLAGFSALDIQSYMTSHHLAFASARGSRATARLAANPARRSAARMMIRAPDAGPAPTRRNAAYISLPMDKLSAQFSARL